MDESLIRNFEDYDFWLRLVQRGYVGSLVAEPLFFYRRHARGNKEKIKAESKAEDRRRQMEKRHPRFLMGDGGDGVQLPPLPDPLAAPVSSDPLVGEWQLMLFGREYSNLTYDGYRRPQTPALFSPTCHDDSRINVLYLTRTWSSAAPSRGPGHSGRLAARPFRVTWWSKCRASTSGTIATPP